MQRFLFSALVCLSSLPLIAQTEIDSLPSHPGALVLNLDGLHVTQRSAKPEGREIGVRVHDAAHTEMLTFLFLTPENKHQSASTCLQQDVRQIAKDNNGKIVQKPNPFGNDGHDSATTLITFPSGQQALFRYAGKDDQCLLTNVYADKGATLDLDLARTIVDRVRYNPDYAATPDDAAKYEAIRGENLVKKTPLPETAPKMLVSWYVPGGVPLPADPDWKLELLTAYNNAGRPAAQFKNDKTGVVASFIISQNVSGKPTSEGCRDDLVDGIRKNEGRLLSHESSDQMSDGHGGFYATASHWTLLGTGGDAHNHDVFAFAANKKTCAEIYVSTVSGKPDEEKRLADAVVIFHPDLLYTPNCDDYFAEANAFYKQSPMMAAPFYDACLNTLPADTNDPAKLLMRRIATDKIVIALGSSGNIPRSRAYAERAIKLDPDYPLYYYNLACADAEQGKAADAKLHLQQAFDRKANTLPGEHLPDPTQDDSIQKLKKNKDFWAFVQTLK